MSAKAPHRKRVKHFHRPGDVHELTFSCYRRMRLLTNDRWRRFLARAIDDATAAERFALVAFVFMPEHVHLLVLPTDAGCDAKAISRFLGAVKRPTSQKVKADLTQRASRLLERLTIRERPGRSVFRYWQEGPGYDRNLTGPETISAAIDYIHMNPVRRGLVKRIEQWKWSSARWYLSEGRHVDAELPRIDGLPAGWDAG